MALKKTQISDQTTETKPTSSNSLYTAKAIASEYGFDASGIEKYYYPEALNLYQASPEVLKEGHLFTQTFHDLVFLFRQRRMRERCVLNEAGLIVRHAPIKDELFGKPVLVKNDNRDTAEAFKSWFWEMNPELIPLVKEDAPETVEVLVEPIPTELAVYKSPSYELETTTLIEGALHQTEQLGQSFGTWREAMRLQAKNEGKAIGGEMIQEMQSEMSATMNDFFQTAQKATKRTK
jgi:hypothetical protein